MAGRSHTEQGEEGFITIGKTIVGIQGSPGLRGKTGEM